MSRRCCQSLGAAADSSFIFEWAAKENEAENHCGRVSRTHAGLFADHHKNVQGSLRA